MFLCSVWLGLTTHTYGRVPRQHQEWDPSPQKLMAEGGFLQTSVLCMARKNRVWGTTMVTSSPASLLTLQMVASQLGSQKHSCRSSAQKGTPGGTAQE